MGALRLGMGDSHSLRDMLPVAAVLTNFRIYSSFYFKASLSSEL